MISQQISLPRTKNLPMTTRFNHVKFTPYSRDFLQIFIFFISIYYFLSIFIFFLIYLSSYLNIYFSLYLSIFSLNIYFIFIFLSYLLSDLCLCSSNLYNYSSFFLQLNF